VEGVPLRLSTKNLHDFGEEYILLSMELDVECWILGESANEAVSRKKGCCGRDSVNFRSKGFPCWKSVDILERFVIFIVSEFSAIFKSQQKIPLEVNTF
jgi:hypothetical protein